MVRSEAQETGFGLLSSATSAAVVETVGDGWNALCCVH